MPHKQRSDRGPRNSPVTNSADCRELYRCERLSLSLEFVVVSRLIRAVSRIGQGCRRVKNWELTASTGSKRPGNFRLRNPAHIAPQADAEGIYIWGSTTKRHCFRDLERPQGNNSMKFHTERLLVRVSVHWPEMLASIGVM